MSETEGQEDGTRLLLEFLRSRDVVCPLCGYNLRDLTRPQCPECRHELRLSVEVTKPKFVWFLLAVIPCAFAGIAACLLLIPMTLQPLMGGGPPEPQVFALAALGWTSALGGVLLMRYRFVFIRQPPGRQRFYTAGVWGLNILALLTFFVVLISL